MNTLEGKLVSEGIKVGIVAARFNEFITSKLIGGARMVCFVTMSRMKMLTRVGSRRI